MWSAPGGRTRGKALIDAFLGRPAGRMQVLADEPVTAVTTRGCGHRSQAPPPAIETGLWSTPRAPGPASGTGWGVAAAPVRHQRLVTALPGTRRGANSRILIAVYLRCPRRPDARRGEAAPPLIHGRSR
jgi:hypothetical protein